MAIQQEISGELMQRFVGTTQRVIIDRQEGDYYIGRTQYDSPEVDCEVLVMAKGVVSDRSVQTNGRMLNGEEVKVGEFVDVEITKAEEFDLYGILC